jgi:predicted nucleotidyltransferase
MTSRSPNTALRAAGGAELERTANRLVELLLTTLDERLVGVYVIGSVASGDARPSVSDLDLLAVVDGALDHGVLVEVGERLADAAMELPMRGLEAVVYRAEALTHPSYPLRIELNVNAGPALERVVSTVADEPFWFLLDIAAARDVRELIGEVNRADVVTALRDSALRGASA